MTPCALVPHHLPEGMAGVVVTDIASDSPSQGLLQVNDVIEEMNRKAVQSAQEYEAIVSKIGEHDTILLLIFRDGGSIYMTIKP